MSNRFYSYEGPVTKFGICIENHWKGTTCAASEKKAINNLAYRYKKQHNLTANTVIGLPGKLIVVDDDIAS